MKNRTFTRPFGIALQVAAALAVAALGVAVCPPGASAMNGPAPAPKGTAAARQAAGAAAQDSAPGQLAPVPAGDTDKTLAALHDELQRSRDRLVLPGQDRPYYIEYRLVDLDIRTITAQFGALISSTTDRNRFMSVTVRVGNYKLDSSNFLSGEGFRGFIGSTGTVGIDRDYNSLRQDLWIATDQSYKEALDSLSKKRAFLRNLASAPTIDDFAQVAPLVDVQPRIELDWTTRNWENEAKTVSAALRKYGSSIENSKVTYHLIYATNYMVSTEGTEIRATRSLAGIEASAGSEADDGAPLHNFLALYANKPAELPAADDVRQRLDRVGQQLVDLRSAPTIDDYDGPMLFEAPAAGSLVSQLLGPSLGGARPPLAAGTRFEQTMQALGGRSDWGGRRGQRVLPTDVNLVDDPTQLQFQGQPLIGGYSVDQEGVRSQKVALADAGILRQQLMSRRPGPDFDQSNGHGRSTYLADPRPLMSNLFFTASDGLSAAELRQKFIDLCKKNGQHFGLIVREMDNPVLATTTQDELTDSLSSLAAGVANGARLPLLVYKVNVDDGSEQLVRGAVLTGLTARSLRTVAGVGNDYAVYSFNQTQEGQLAGTALGMFGSAEGGVPTSVVAPSLLFDEVEVLGPHNEPRRMPLVSPPPLQ